ncbi:1-phosphofructokinase family hexose kinase [Tsukamurella sp. 8F]|uniref:1-phosphofructokinase family hexose kinase n=1 Tax=unclassified Tsukamurella TaxID=2633480 RepID=UPI0023B994F4|nr:MULTISPECIES: 1-phosphofructokinase family hexose kinase [unclassified Tsukamurella]MDF0531520.1 1-phosphofructokinase family hexose kinase [Tsukamurella sp. 8J]MDF0588764.1 1-phosphofructokinase family hexose kinase [Tsukamurella sp. 8F]
MIVTVTANPSLDRTVVLGTPLERGAVLRATEATAEPGGKGVNVSRAVHAAGVPTLAVLPASLADPVVTGLDRLGVVARPVPIGVAVRSNVTVTEPDGTTTKLNVPGAYLDSDERDALFEAVVAAASGADWVALCGSLPPGLDEDWYARLVRRLSGTRVAVDTSGPALAAVATPGVGAALLKPNAEELGELTGFDGVEAEKSAGAGDLGPVLVAATALQASSGADVLATLGAAGALLVTSAGGWAAKPPKIVPRSTVGAGDCSLAGYLLAHRRGAGPGECLRSAVAYGAAATSLPGTAVPRPDQVELDGVVLTALQSAP